ncbi:hypothetical protein KJ596_02555 [Patescibacteria group bacterium]|nr:hypothetical protein [Patescibacteria group bacterium]MBU1868672.1 hypothetical protein [Patescibacteria group bacterium]
MKLPILSKLFKPRQPEPFMMLDLGTTTVKAGIFRLLNDPEPGDPTFSNTPKIEVLALSQQRHGQASFLGSKIQQPDAVLEACSLAIEKANLEASIMPQQTTLLAGGFTKTVNTKIKLQRAEVETPVTESELNKIFRKIEERTAERSLIKASQLFRAPPESLQRLSTEAIEFRLDGKKLSSPIDFGGEELKISLKETFCLQETHKTLSQLGDTLGLRISQIRDPIFAPLNFLKDEFARGILIDIGGKLTEVALFSEGEILGGYTFNWGGYHFTWNLMRHLDLNFDNADNLKIAASQRKLNDEKQQGVDRLTQPWLDILMTGIAACLKQMNYSSSFPENFFIYGGGLQIPNLKSAFIAYPWTKNLSFSTFPKPRFLELSEIPNISGEISKINEPAFVSLVSAALGSTEVY